MGDVIDKKWFANSPEQFHWAVWEEEEDAVLYHEGSGNTLKLNPMGEFLLKELLHAPKNIDGLCDNASKYFDIENNQDLLNTVISSMQRFRYLGLVLSDSL